MMAAFIELFVALAPILGPLVGALLLLTLQRFRLPGSFLASMGIWGGIAFAVWYSQSHWPSPFSTPGFGLGQPLLGSFATHFRLSLEALPFLKLFTVAGVLLSAFSQANEKDPSRASGDLIAIFLCVASAAIFTLAASLASIVLGALIFGSSIPIALANRGVSWSSALVRLLTGFGLGLAILLLGVMLVQLAVPSLNLELIRQITQGSQVGTLGLTLVLVGAAICMGWAPFNVLFVSTFATSPHGVSAYLDMLGKLALVGLAFNLSPLLEPVTWEGFGLVAFVGTLAMVWGALGAIGETRLARLLYFSGLVHGGFLLLVGSSAEFSFGAFMIFLTHLGLYGLACFLEKNHPFPDIHLLSGFGLQFPYLGATIGLLLLSMAGLPPSGIYLVRWTGVWTTPWGLLALVPWLSLIFAAMRILFLMYARSPQGDIRLEESKRRYNVILGVCAVALLLGAILPTWFGGYGIT